MSKTRKNCGTCEHWTPPEELEGTDGLGQCTYDAALPFWSYMGNPDHSDYTDAADGSRCETWDAKETPKERGEA